METISLIVAENFKRLREEKKLSLDAVAKLSGVSKSMLGQLERGDVNPTVSTVWKIASGLKVSFTELMSRPESDFELVSQISIQPLLEDNGKFRNFPIFPFDSERRFEIYTIELDPGAYLQAEAHPGGAQEFITVFSGRIVVILDEEELEIEDGSSLRFRADRPHAYRNKGGVTCRLNMVIYYPKN